MLCCQLGWVATRWIPTCNVISMPTWSRPAVTHYSCNRAVTFTPPKSTRVFILLYLRTSSSYPSKIDQQQTALIFFLRPPPPTASGRPDWIKMITRFITDVTTRFNPFSPRAKPARLFLALLPPSARSSGTSITTHLLPRTSTEPSTLLIKFSAFYSPCPPYTTPRRLANMAMAVIVVVV